VSLYRLALRGITAAVREAKLSTRFP